MRTGAIFARGSCRALKWTALFGVVFMLGAASAAAQVKISGDKGVKGDEGTRVTITVSADVRVAAAQADAQTVTIAAPTASTTGITVDQAKMTTPADGTDGADDYTLPGAGELRIPGNSSTTDPMDTTVSATFTIQLQSDADAEDELFDVLFAAAIGTDLAALTGVTQKGGTTDFTALSDAARTRRVTINDTDDQEFVWEVTTAKPREDASIAVTLTAKPDPNELEYVTALRVDTTGYSLSPSSWTFDDDVNTSPGATDGPMAAITITAPDSDKNRETDTIMVEATVAGTASNRVPALAIEVADIHALPMADKISAKAYTDDGEGKPSKTETMSVMEGGDPVHVTVTVDRGTTGYPDGEDLKVTVMADPSQALDYRVDSAMLTVAKGTGEKKATFKLWALNDDDVGAEDLMLQLKVEGASTGATSNGPGEVMQMFSIAIEDDTTAKVWVKDGAMDAIYGARDAAAGDDEMTNPGENFEIMTDDLFGHLPTVTVAYAASSDNSAVGVSASGEKIMVMPQDMAGTAKITITATATDKASSFQTSQDRSDVAHIMFEVDVVVPAVEPEPDNLVTAKSDEEIGMVLDAAGLGDDDMFNPGATLMVDASMLFDAAEGVSVSYAAESDDMAAVTTSVSGSMVSVMAGEVGHAHITITATAIMASGIEIYSGQPATNVATVLFSVNVVPADLMLTLSGPEDMNLVEGGMGGMVTVTANRGVTEDMEVMLMRDRAMSSASDDDFTAEAIMIKAGEMMGSTMVMAVEDDMAEDMEELVLFAMAGDMEVAGTAKLYLWDAAVPALPIIAQLLLAFFLAIGGYRRYLRR